MMKTLTETEGKALFPQIKTLCLPVLQSPSSETLKQMREQLSNLLGSRAFHPQMVDYVLLPVRMAMNKCGSSNLRLLESILETLETVLLHVHNLDKWELFQNLFTYLCMHLDTKMAKEAGFPEQSEDLTLVTIKALKALLISPHPSVRQLLFSDLPGVGHCVSVLLNIVQSFSSKTLRQQTLSALLALSGVNSQSLSSYIFLRSDNDKNMDSIDIVKHLNDLVAIIGIGPEGCGRVFASFLPGISMAITKLVTSETNLGSSVTVLCLLTWAHYVSIVMKDSECQLAKSEDEKVIKGSNYEKISENETSEKKLAVKRSLSWQQRTDAKLCILVQRMSGLLTSASWRVRMGLVSWTHTLLSHTYRTLTTSTPHLLECLVTLSHDDYLLISNSARRAITVFSQCYDGNQSDLKLASLLEGRVHSLCSALPRLMRQNDDKRKIATLQLLSGYLQLLKSRVKALTHSHAHLSRLVTALVQTLEPAVSDTRIVEQPSNRDFVDVRVSSSQQSPMDPLTIDTSKTLFGASNNNKSDSSKLALRFAHFREERIEILLYSVCRLLGQYGNIQVVLDHLIDLYQSSTTQRKEVLIILAQVFTGIKDSQNETSSLPSEELFPLVEGVVLELMEAYNDDCSGKRVDEEQPYSHQGSILHSCLLLNVILMCARVLEKMFDPLLQQLVYPLLQWLGDDENSVSVYARGVVLSIASLCHYRSLQDFISRNADYLVNATALNLRRPSSLEHHLRATHVLRAILTHGNEDVLPLMRDSVDELLFALDTRRQSPIHIWPTLHALSENCLRWISYQPSVPPTDSTSKEDVKDMVPNVCSRKNVDSSQAQTGLSPDDIKQFFLNYHQQKDQADENETVGDDLLEEDDSYLQKKKLSPVTEAAVSVIQRCVHHLSATSQQVQLLVLEALANAILSLKYDQTTLLPEVHDVWSSFLPRLSDPIPPVAVKAWKVILVMCEVCKGFLRKRVVTKVWPPLIKSLESLAPKSINAEPLYRQSSQYKLQQCLLSCVGTLCVQLAVPSCEVEGLASSTLPYLSVEQPQGLQDTCLTCFRDLIGYDPDIVWLLLQQLCSNEAIYPENSTLRQYSFRQYELSDKFSNNVKNLLETFC